MINIWQRDDHLRVSHTQLNVVFLVSTVEAGQVSTDGVAVTLRILPVEEVRCHKTKIVCL